MERWSPLVVLVAVLLLWQAVVMLFDIPEFIFPSPLQIAQQFGEFTGPAARGGVEDLLGHDAGLCASASWWACCWAS